MSNTVEIEHEIKDHLEWRGGDTATYTDENGNSWTGPLIEAEDGDLRFGGPSSTWVRIGNGKQVRHLLGTFKVVRKLRLPDHKGAILTNVTITSPLDEDYTYPIAVRRRDHWVAYNKSFEPVNHWGTGRIRGFAASYGSLGDLLSAAGGAIV